MKDDIPRRSGRDRRCTALYHQSAQRCGRRTRHCTVYRICGYTYLTTVRLNVHVDVYASAFVAALPDGAVVVLTESLVLPSSFADATGASLIMSLREYEIDIYLAMSEQHTELLLTLFDSSKESISAFWC